MPIRMAVIKKDTSNKYRWRYGIKGTLILCWWEYKLVHPLKKYKFYNKTENGNVIGPSNFTTGCITEKSNSTNLKRYVHPNFHSIYRYIYSYYLHLLLLLLLPSHFSRVTLCDAIDASTLGSSVPGILQARTLEWVAISSSNAWKWKVKVKSLCRVWLLATPWPAAFQAPPSMGFSRQEYWSGIPFPSLEWKPSCPPSPCLNSIWKMQYTEIQVNEITRKSL